MAWPWKPTPYGPRGRDLQWINTCMGAHDMYCGCEEPPKHLLCILLQHSGKLGLQKKHIKITQKCLGYGEEKEDTTDGTHGSTTVDTAVDDNIDIGDLDALFAEDTEPTG